MRRWLLVVALVLGPTVGLASADYIILKIDLNKLFRPAPPDDGKGQPGGQPGQQPAGPKNGAQDDNEPPLWAYAYLEQHKKVAPKIYQESSPPYDRFTMYKVEHRWGKTQIYVHSNFVGKHFVQLSMSKRFEEKAKKVEKEGKTAEKLLDLAEWALEHGLFAECERTMDDLKALEPNNSTLRAFQQTQKAINAPLTRDDPAAADLIDEQSKAGYRIVHSKQGHYTLLTNLKSPQNHPGVLRRLARMEETYKGMFYWFALKGRPLTPPSHRLVAVLVRTTWEDNQDADFHKMYASFDSPMLVGDGFTARRDNVVLLASTSFDEVLHHLQKNNQLKFTQEYSVSSAELLGDPSALIKKRPPWIQKLPVMQLSAVVQHAMEEDAETATVTHEAARQLAAATGLIPRNVNTAEWARFGLASFFETGRHGFYTTIGGPNWFQKVRFKNLLNTKRVTAKNAAHVLLDVVSDKYFQQIEHVRRQLYETAEGKDDLEPKLAKEMRLAQATAWSLTHFLARDRLGELLAYYGELSSLPRDVEYDATVQRGCFARAFGLLTKDSDPRKQVLDMARVEKLAQEWLSAIEERAFDIDGYEKEELDRLENEDNPPPPPKTDPNPAVVPGPGPARPAPGYRPNPGAGRRPPGMYPGGRPSGPGVRPPGRRPGRR